MTRFDKMVLGEDSKTLFLMNYAYMNKQRKRECAWLTKKTLLEDFELNILDYVFAEVTS